MWQVKVHVEGVSWGFHCSGAWCSEVPSEWSSPPRLTDPASGPAGPPPTMEPSAFTTAPDDAGPDQETGPDASIPWDPFCDKSIVIGTIQCINPHSSVLIGRKWTRESVVNLFLCGPHFSNHFRDKENLGFKDRFYLSIGYPQCIHSRRAFNLPQKTPIIEHLNPLILLSSSVFVGLFLPNKYARREVLLLLESMLSGSRDEIHPERQQGFQILQVRTFFLWSCGRFRSLPQRSLVCREEFGRWVWLKCIQPDRDDAKTRK